MAHSFAETSLIGRRIGDWYNPIFDHQLPEGVAVKVSLERNLSTDFSAEVYPYTVRVEICTATIDVGHVYQIPAFVRYRGLEKSFGVDVCGFRVVAKRPHDLTNEVEALLRKLISTARLPTYVFVARLTHKVFPVYTVHDEVVAFTSGGVVFRHVELAKVREYLTDYLHDVGILGEKGRDKLHVRGVSQTTLGLRRPVFYLKKRVPGQTDFWAPVFQSGDGRTIYAYAASRRQEVARQGGEEVLTLWEQVARALIADRRLKQVHDLRPDRLMPGFWEQLRSRVTAVGAVEANGVAASLYRRGDLWIGVETRADEERFGLFMGTSAQDVAARMEQDFTRRNIAADDAA